MAEDRSHAKRLVDKYLSEMEPEPEPEPRPEARDPVLDDLMQKAFGPDDKDAVRYILGATNFPVELKGVAALIVMAYEWTKDRWGTPKKPDYVEVSRNMNSMTWLFEVGYRGARKFSVAVPERKVMWAWDLMPQSSAAARGLQVRVKKAERNAIPWLSDWVNVIFNALDER